MQIKNALTVLLLFFVTVTHAQKTQTETLPIEEQTVVTVEENFGPHVNTVAQALALIERKYVAYDNTTRTFAILEATGNKMPGGKVHLDIRISTEKAGTGKLILKTTKKVLWQCIVTAKEGRKAYANKTLTINVEQDVAGRKQFFTADGSNNPPGIFASTLKENGKTVNETWKEGTVKEVMFIYSACGCPVHVKFLRKGMGTIKQDKNQELFPDDPEVASMLKRLMNWQ